jgi:ABC-type Fe3+-hydroxamate transport system substrate-binding protein
MRDCVSRTSDDDCGRPVRLASPTTAVVSLVPSLTEAIEASAPGLVVGATDWCTHPPGLTVTRIGGTKNPRIDDIVALGADVVIANDEENREPDIAALVDRGQSVWVTAPRTVPAALSSLDRMLRLACGLERPAWLDDAVQSWAASYNGPRRRAVVPIWRRPWMVLGRDTFAGDLLARLGVDNVMAEVSERYPKVTLEELRDRQPDLIVLPDEPYAFGWDDGPEAFADWNVPVACVSGRHLTWYGPSLVEAREVLSQQLADARYSKECSGPG